MIEELLRARLGQETKRPPALAAELLQEAAERYAAARENCRFRIGAVVTPRKDSSMRGAGDPHIVVELIEHPTPDFSGPQAGSNRFGATVDMRVLWFLGDNIAAHWVESWEFELWQSQALAPAEPT